MPEWRNGRRTRLKIWRWQHRAGSSPASGTTIKSADSIGLNLLSALFIMPKILQISNGKILPFYYHSLFLPLVCSVQEASPLRLTAPVQICQSLKSTSLVSCREIALIIHVRNPGFQLMGFP